MVFGFFTCFVGFGVTDTVSRHVPFFKAFTDEP
jgi:hypothetical protein